MDILESLVIILAASAVVVYVLNRAGIPSIAGFLVTGIIIGPSGLGFVKDTHAIEVLAEIGVILLLFTIGIEFSLSRLMRMKKIVFGAGAAQVMLTIAVSAAGAFLVTGDTNTSIFVGFIIALSSTAIVLKTLAERGEIDTPHGRLMVGILIFQDLCVVPLMLLIPVLGGESSTALDVAIKMGKAALIIAFVLTSSRWIVPPLLHRIVSTRSRELFIITIILLCLGIALLTSKFGLSLALGAFLAGLVVSESEYAHQATADILPFKDSFMGLFFVSVGMLIDAGYSAGRFSQVGMAVGLVLTLKLFTGVVSGLAVGMPVRASIHGGLGLAQIGEFSFVLAVAGKSAHIITEDFYQIFLSSSVATMILTPFILKYAHPVSSRIAALRHMKKLRTGAEREVPSTKKQGHVIIIGFGLNGKNLALVLKEAQIPYVVVEINSDTVGEMKKKGEPIYYGDAANREILHRLGVERARLLVIAISDPVSTRRIVSIARHENPGLHILVRTRYLIEVDDMKALGADEVIPEEFETSIEIFSRVLHKYNFPQNIIFDMINKIRTGNYDALRRVDLPKRQLFEKCEWLPDIEINGFRIPDGSPVAARSIGELQVRRKTGATIIAVRRDEKVHANPHTDFRFHAGDIILFTGDQRSMDAALRYFAGRAQASED